jgi:peptidoglycan pentaglycine glycine transferase (the first glycine)
MRVEYSLAERNAWNEVIASLPKPHLLQTREWGEVKNKFGWRAYHYIWTTEQGRICAAAQILERSVPIPILGDFLRILYVPKGPLLDWKDSVLRKQVLRDLITIARKQNAIWIKIDPDVVAGTGYSEEDDAWNDPSAESIVANLEMENWRFSVDQIQFRNTCIIDLTPEAEILLGNMKQKTRYNIRLATRKGVQVRVGEEDDLTELYRIYAQTSLRDGFVIREENYYLSLWNTFMRSGMMEPLIAEVDNRVISGLMLFHFSGVAWYLFGMSSGNHREKMPNYLLQWEAILRAKAHGCRTYDLWGAPDLLTENDPLWGVYRFKRGLGAVVIRHIGAWDYILRPWMFRLYAQLLPNILNVMRRRGITRTRQLTT